MKNIILIGIVICIALLPIVSAVNDYYADIEIDISPTGLVSARGITNHPKLNITETNSYTSKKGVLWTLNISIEEEFSDYVYSVNFPKSSVISYLKTPSSMRIVDENGKLSVKATGKNEKFYILAQYRIEKNNSFNFPTISNVVIYSSLIIISLIITGWIISKSKKPAILKPHYNPEFLTERQKVIVDFVMKNNNSVTQAIIEKELKIPKSSLSRNIDFLVRKGVLKKESTGMTNIIYFDTKQENVQKQV